MRLRIHLSEGASEWESSVALFRVGRADSCALRFEGEAAKYAGWEHAEFRVDDQGTAFVTDLESKNGTYVEGLRIAAPTPLRTGDVIQIGTKGPTLEVLELCPVAPRAVSAAASMPSADQRAAPKKLAYQNLVIGAAVAVIATVVALLLRSNAAAPVPNPPAIAGALPVEEDVAQPKVDPKKRSDEPIKAENAAPAEQDLNVERPKEMERRPSHTSPDGAKALAAYRLIVAEDPETHVHYPLSGAVVVADHTLLTTAAPTLELAKFVAKHWPLKAMKPSDGYSVDVRALRINPLFQHCDPDEQLFSDVALLYTDEPLTDVAVLATDDELERLELDGPLACIAADHDRIAFKGRRELPAVAHPGIILEPHFPRQVRSGGIPGALTLRGRFHDWYFGSPIVNDRGHLVAIYCGPAADGAADKHIARVIDPSVIAIGLNEPDSSIWVKPVAIPPRTQESAK